MGGRGRRGQGRDRVKESGRGGGRENRTNIQTHERVEKEERDTAPALPWPNWAKKTWI